MALLDLATVGVALRNMAWIRAIDLPMITAALLEARAREMRTALTPSEQLLWSRISGRKLGVVFRRQVPLIGRFIADFYAPAARLVVEVDGAYHAERGRADARRHSVLGRAGYCVLRFHSQLVFRDPDAAVASIRASL